MTILPIAWGLPTLEGLVLDVICPAEHERYEGAYTLPLYSLTPEQVVALQIFALESAARRTE